MPVQVVRVARLVFVVLLLGIGSFLSTGTATAGGPTSALLVSPTEEQAIGLYSSEPEYGRLQELLAEPPIGAASAESGAPETASDYVTVTWLIHDVTVWRIDRVFLPAKGEPFIVTQNVWDSSGDASAHHHRSPDPAALTALLEKLGLIKSSGASPMADFNPAAADSAVLATETASKRADLELTGSAAAGGWWLLGGLVVGIATCALTVRYVPAVRRRVLARTPGPEPVRPGDEPVRMWKLQV